MKKVLFVLAAIAMVGCSNEEVLDLNQNEIAFGENFVENATRAEYNNDTNLVGSFKVWGVEGTTAIYAGAEVTRGGAAYGDAWSCDVVKFWHPSQSYKFAAIVDGTAATLDGNLPATIEHTVATGNEDLLYAEATATTNEAATPSVANGIVPFQFSHLLSKVQFTIENATDAYKFNVTSINVSGVAQTSTYTVDSETWAAATGTPLALTFGTAADVVKGTAVVASETHQILPVAQTLNVTVEYEIKNATTGVVVGTMTKTGTIDQTFAKNTVYNVKATLTANTIEFTVSTVDAWTPAGGDVTLS